MTAGRDLWAGLHLLDRQMVDRDGVSVGKVDDLAFRLPDAPGELPVVTHILCGQAALAHRISPRLGRLVERLRRLIHPVPDPGPASISFGAVTDIRTDIHLAIDRREAPTIAVDRWLAVHVLGPVPGAGVRPAEQRESDA